MQNTKSDKIFAIIVCAFLLFSIYVQVHQVRAQETAQIIIYPNLIQFSLGDNFTIAVNATNVAALNAWQLTLKYNVSVVTVTSMWVPTGTGVFGSASQIGVEADWGIDIKDHMGFVNFGSALLGEPVPVSNGILCMANLTAVGEGETTILIATSTDRAHKTSFEYDAFYSYLLDSNNLEVPCGTKSATMIVGGGASKPIALFTETTITPSEASVLMLRGHPPPGNTVFLQTYKDYPITFNASDSFGLMTLDNGTRVLSTAAIALYNWDFGDGNLTSTSNSIITHTYTSPGTFRATLTVQDKENPPATSDATPRTIIVGLTLEYFNWWPFIYAVFAIVIVGAVYYATKQTRDYMRARRELKARRLVAGRRVSSSETNA